MSNSPPSRDPSGDGTLAGLVELFKNKLLQDVDDCLPAVVLSYDRNAQPPRVRVQPLIQVLTTDGGRVSRAPIASVPVYRPGGGDLVLDFPLNPGDFGWIKASDRDLSNFFARLREAAPNTLRKHSFQDAHFIPDAMRAVTINAEDAERVVLQTTDGSMRVSVGVDGVHLVAGASRVDVTPAGVDITGALTINGQPYLSHTHGGGTIGSGNTAGVNP